METELQSRKQARETTATHEPEVEISELIAVTQEEMLAAAERMEFEQAALLRDQLTKLKRRQTEAATAGGTTKVRASEFAGSTGRSSREKPKSAPGTPGTRAGKKGRKPTRKSD